MKSAAGFTLIEMMIVIAILAVIMSIAIPSYRTTLASNKVKATADSILSGLHRARSGAINSNVPVRFQLVSDFGNTCALSTTSPNWVVTETNQLPGGTGNPVNKCDMGAWYPADPCVDSGVHVCATDPFITARSSINHGVSVTVTANQSVVVFSPLGRVLDDQVTGLGANHMTLVQVRSTVAGARQLNVTIGDPSGSIKICDALAAAGSAYAC